MEEGKITNVQLFDRALPETEIKLLYEITQLKTDLAKAEQDGKRLDWLEQAQPHQWIEITDNFGTWDLREAIDEAMEVK